MTDSEEYLERNLDLNQQPHRRLNPLTGEWILVSPHRAKRPWQGQVEDPPAEKRPHYDPGCYLCPGNERAGGEKRNPEYSGTYVFDNDFSALRLDASTMKMNHSDLLQARGEPGICRVVCFSPRHDLTLPDLAVPDIRKVVDVWTAQYRELGALEPINYVQIFENKGAVMGCSNPHPHGQIWAQHSIPAEPLKELKRMQAYLREKNRCLLCDYIQLERELGERMVIENDDFVIVVPYWAVWPYEVLLASKRHFGSLPEMTEKEKDSLAAILKTITIKYDNLFKISFPYSAGFHQSPTDGEEHLEWHFHMHFYPPLLRSATVKKFMVGYEMLGNPQRDITAEWSAEKLRMLPEELYR